MNRINTHMGAGPARERSIQVESTSIVLGEMELQRAEPDHEAVTLQPSPLALACTGDLTCRPWSQHEPHLVSTRSFQPNSSARSSPRKRTLPCSLSHVAPAFAVPERLGEKAENT